MIVVDASVLATALGDDGAEGERARVRLTAEQLVAPELIDLEVASVWRGALRGRHMTDDRAHQALADLSALPLARAPHAPLIRRIWELRDDVSVYDAAYVALAEALDVPVLTADRKLTQATGARCEFELLQ